MEEKGRKTKNEEQLCNVTLVVGKTSVCFQ